MVFSQLYCLSSSQLQSSSLCSWFAAHSLEKESK